MIAHKERRAKGSSDLDVELRMSGLALEQRFGIMSKDRYERQKDTIDKILASLRQ